MHSSIVVIFFSAIFLITVGHRFSSDLDGTDNIVSKASIIASTIALIACIVSISGINEKYNKDNVIDKWSIMSINGNEVTVRGSTGKLRTMRLNGMTFNENIDKNEVVEVRCYGGLVYDDFYFINY